MVFFFFCERSAWPRITTGTVTQFTLHSRNDTRILIPAEQGILAAVRLRVLNVGPALHEVLVRQDARQLARHGAVHVFHDGEVSREEDVEVAL